MVNVQKGVLINCDPALKQYLKYFLFWYVDGQRMLGRSFIVKDLDETHLFVDQEIIPALEDQIDDLMDQLTPEQQQAR